MKVVVSPEIEVQVLANFHPSTSEILSDDALRFVGLLCYKFQDRRKALLKNRELLATEFDALLVPKFKNSAEVSENSWKCAPIPSDVADRRVEITGPVDRKMVINGLNSGANVYMADFEDSTSPTWNNIIDGQRNLKDAVDGTISFVNDKTGKVYRLNKQTAVLFVRPRGWHLTEAHITINGQPASGSIVDFALYFYHNIHNLLKKGTSAYYYLPKLESSLEARLWNDVFIAAQDYLGVPRGTIRATVLLETITAAFEMEDILYELKEHSLGLNCGRWDYLFSYIKKFKYHEDKIAPDRSYLTMDTPLMQAYVKRLIYICHKRGTFAMGGMSAAIPIKGDVRANEEAMTRVEKDKLREVLAGHDGTWVAHPALVQLAKNVFDLHMPTPNQININPGLDGKFVSEYDLLQLPSIPHGQAITSAGLQKGIGIVVAYTEAWLRGVGCIPLYNHMEDAATAEISRVQIWQWRHHNLQTQDDGVTITSHRIHELVNEEVRKNMSKGGRWLLAGQLVGKMLTNPKLDDFLTSVCYDHITTLENVSVPSRL